MNSHRGFLPLAALAVLVLTGCHGPKPKPTPSPSPTPTPSPAPTPQTFSAHLQFCSQIVGTCVLGMDQGSFPKLKITEIDVYPLCDDLARKGGYQLAFYDLTTYREPMHYNTAFKTILHNGANRDLTDESGGPVIINPSGRGYPSSGPAIGLTGTNPKAGIEGVDASACGTTRITGTEVK